MRQSGIENGRKGERRRAGARETEALRIVFPQLEPRSLSLRPIHAASSSLFVPRSFTLSPSWVAPPSHPQSTLTRNKSIHVSADYLAECSRPTESLQPNPWGWRRDNPKEKSSFSLRLPFPCYHRATIACGGGISFSPSFLFIWKTGRSWELAS